MIVKLHSGLKVKGLKMYWESESNFPSIHL